MPPHPTPTIFCSQCGTPAQVCPCGETHRRYTVEVCGRCTATGGMPVPIVTRSRWSCLALVTLVSGVFIAGAILALSEVTQGAATRNGADYVMISTKSGW